MKLGTGQICPYAQLYHILTSNYFDYRKSKVKVQCFSESGSIHCKTSLLKKLIFSNWNKSLERIPKKFNFFLPGTFFTVCSMFSDLISSFFVHLARWQATQCSGSNSRHSGFVSEHCSSAIGQRVWKVQPDGGSAGLGTSP